MKKKSSLGLSRFSLKRKADPRSRRVGTRQSKGMGLVTWNKDIWQEGKCITLLLWLIPWFIMYFLVLHGWVLEWWFCIIIMFLISLEVLAELVLWIPISFYSRLTYLIFLISHTQSNPKSAEARHSCFKWKMIYLLVSYKKMTISD